MIIAWLIKNPKWLAIGLLSIVMIGTFSAYAWQRGSLIKSKAELATVTKEKAEQVALVTKLQQDVKDAKAHEKRVEVIKYRDRVVKEIITGTVPADSPIVPTIITATPEEKEVCKRYVEREERSQKQMAAVRDAADLITDFYNGKLHSENPDQIRAEILSKTAEVGAIAPADHAGSPP